MKNLNKPLIIGLGILIVFGLGAIIFLFLQPAPATGPTKNIATQQGTVTVQDYTDHPIASTDDVYVLAQADSYEVVNLKIDNSFLITLLAEPLNQSRQAAETALLNQLKISQADACKLNVSVTVPQSIDTTYSGQELGLSFCPNAMQLP
ncbi:MAG TPA: hypothetical protein VHA30_01745 [Patescibacteria group bacterium]|nr:hypothetical protein [Patescibacteria group bacterium]